MMDSGEWGIVGAVLAVLAVLGAAASRIGGALKSYQPMQSGAYKRPPDELKGFDHVREHANRIADMLGLSDQARDELEAQLLIQADTESKANNLVGLGLPERYPEWTHSAKKTPTAELVKEAASATGDRKARLERTIRLRTNESRAAEKGYDRRGSYKASPYPRADWAFGSGGYYGQLPSTAFASFRPNKSGHDALKSGAVHPYDVFDPWRSSVMQADFIRRILKLPHFTKLEPEHQNMLAVKRAAAGLFLVKDVNGDHKRAAKINSSTGPRVSKFGFPKSIATRRLSRELVTKWPKGGAYELMRRGEGTA